MEAIVFEIAAIFFEIEAICFGVEAIPSGRVVATSAKLQLDKLKFVETPSKLQLED